MPSEKQIQTAINFVLVVLGLNWLTFQVEKINQNIVNQDYEKIMNGHHREVFHSFAGIMIVQKAFVYGFGLLILFILRKISDKTDSDRSQNLNEKNDTKSEIESDEQIKTSSPKQSLSQEFNETITQQILKTQNKTSLISISNKDGFKMGILLFVSSIIISQIERKITFIFIISFKYIGMLVFFCLFHLIILPKIGKQGFQAKGFVKKMLLMIAVSGSGCVAKILGELYGFYMANAGMVDLEMELSGIFGLVLVIILDNLLYIAMNNVKHLKPGLTTLELMTSLAMWTSLFYLIYSICISEFGYTISFIFNHPQIIYSLLRLSFVNFWIQFLIYFSFLSYEPHIFISIIASRGMFSNLIPDMFKYLTIMSVFYYVACFGLIYFAFQLTQGTSKIGIKKKQGDSLENSYNEVELEQTQGNQSMSQEKQYKI